MNGDQADVEDAQLEVERESGRAKTRARIARTGDPFLGAAVSDPEPF